MKPSFLILAMLAATAARAGEDHFYSKRPEMKPGCAYVEQDNGWIEMCGVVSAVNPKIESHKAWCSEIGKNLYHLCDVVDPPEYQQ
jgi:hypothetical protein